MATRTLVSTLTLAGAIATSACDLYAGSWNFPTTPSTPAFISYAGVVRDDSGRLPGGTVGLPLSGVRLEVLSGPQKGQFVTTGADGVFILSLSSGYESVQASKAGWETFIGSQSTGQPVLGQAPHVLWGFVYPPVGSVGVAGVRVEIINGANAGKVTFTNAEGLYRFDGLDSSESFSLRFSAPNEVNELSSVTELKRNVQSNWRLKTQ